MTNLKETFTNYLAVLTEIQALKSELRDLGERLDKLWGRDYYWAKSLDLYFKIEGQIYHLEAKKEDGYWNWNMSIRIVPKATLVVDLDELEDFKEIILSYFELQTQLESKRKTLTDLAHDLCESLVKKKNSNPNSPLAFKVKEDIRLGEEFYTLKAKRPYKIEPYRTFRGYDLGYRADGNWKVKLTHKSYINLNL